MFIFRKIQSNVDGTADDLRAASYVLFEVTDKLNKLANELEEPMAYRLYCIKELVNAANSIVGGGEYSLYDASANLYKLPDKVKKMWVEQEIVVTKPPRPKKKKKTTGGK